MAECTNLVTPLFRPDPCAFFFSTSYIGRMNGTYTYGRGFIRCLCLSLMNTTILICRAVYSQKEGLAASVAKSKLTQELEAAAARNEELCQTAKENEKEFQVRGN